MDLKEALSYIEGTLKFGSVLGLDNIKELLNRLGNPQKDLKVIHVAGTNGKGSTCAFLNHILMAEGYKVGFYSSPSLESFNERIRVDFENISNDDLIALTVKVKEIVEDMVEGGLTHPTEFELVTAMALLYFKEVACDFVVLEVGLGGRYDSTNVCEEPFLTIITPIGLDHVHILGDSLGKIAYEKGGIIKKDRPLILHPQEPEANEVIMAIAAEKSVEVIEPQTMNFKMLDHSLNNIKFLYGGDEFNLSMTGTYQIPNSIMAIEAAKKISGMGYEISLDAIVNGLKNTIWPARFEVISKDPYVVIDGAHNDHGAKALMETLELHTQDMHRVACFGAFGDKDVDTVLRMTESYFDIFVMTCAPHERSLSVEFLEKKLRVINPHKKVILSESLEDAIDKMNAIDAGFKLYYGSLHMVGQIRKRLKK